MSELDPAEATRREFEAVMRLGRFATIDQVAADLLALGDVDRTPRSAAPARPATGAGASPALPARRAAS